MRTQFFRAALALCVASFVAGGALAADTPPKVSSAVAKPLSEALKLAQAKDFVTALAKVKEAQAVTTATDFDKYKINEVLGYVAVNLDDRATALTAYEAMVESPLVAPADKKDALHNAMLLATDAKQYQKVIQYAPLADQAGGMDAKEISALSEAYYYMNDFAHAQSVVQKEIDAAVAAGKVPDKATFDVLFTTQVRQKDQAGAIKTLEVLAQDYGGPDDWGQLIDSSLGTKGETDLDILYLYRLQLAADAQVRPEDYTLIASIAEQAGYPVEAVAVLERGIAKGTITNSGKVAAMLAGLRPKAAADSKSLDTFDKAARAKPAGDYDLKLAQTYYGYARYADSEEAARRAISKGGLKDPQQAQAVLAMALTMQGKNPEALQIFSQLHGNPAIEKVAHLWSLYAGRKYTAAATAR